MPWTFATAALKEEARQCRSAQKAAATGDRSPRRPETWDTRPADRRRRDRVLLRGSSCPSAPTRRAREAPHPHFGRLQHRLVAQEKRKHLQEARTSTSSSSDTRRPSCLSTTSEAPRCGHSPFDEPRSAQNPLDSHPPTTRPFMLPLRFSERSNRCAKRVVHLRSIHLDLEP